MTDNEILTLVDRLERCLIPPAEFRHQQHLTVAVTYLYGAEPEAALNKMRASLLRFVEYHGGTRYHETITRFWMLKAEKHLDRNICLHQSVELVLAALANKDLIYQYYSRERLNSAEAKKGWVEPDIL